MTTVAERLAAIETKLEDIHEDLLALKALEKRISSLEHWRAYILGGFAVVGIVSPILGALLAYLFRI